MSAATAVAPDRLRWRTGALAWLVPHRSLFVRPIAWPEVAQIRFMAGWGDETNAVDPPAERWLTAIPGVDNEDVAAERFAAAARARLEPPRSVQDELTRE